MSGQSPSHEDFVKAFEELFPTLGVSPCPCGSTAIHVGALSASTRGVECFKCGLNLPIEHAPWLVRRRDFDTVEEFMKANDAAYDEVVKKKWNALFPARDN